MILSQRDSLQRMLDVMSMPSISKSGFLFSFFFYFSKRRISYRKPITEKEVGFKDNIQLFDHEDCSHPSVPHMMLHSSGTSVVGAI